MGETIGDAPTAPKSKPTIMVPPRASMGFLFTNGSAPGFSPGPMTLVSSFFPEQGPFSFSQLLAGAMSSPLALKPPTYDSAKEDKDRPVNLAAPQLETPSPTPLFMVPPGLSPTGLLSSPGYLSPIQSPFGMSHQQALAHVTAQAALSQSFMQMQAEFQHSSSTDAAEAVANRSSSTLTETLTRQKNPSPPVAESSKKESSEVSQSDKKVAYVAGEKPASDGYNWRKYGQKHVKASECPRSYYKCTHLNCPVKKKVERSLDGHISEVTYKGQHNHDPPVPNKREKDISVLDRPTNSVQSVFASQGPTETETERLNDIVTVNSEPKNLGATSQQSFQHHPVASHNNDEKDTALVVYEGDAVEPIAKRRSLDIGPSVPAPSHQTVSESKIVLQTRSEVDLLDDGYKWRKYGQKVVKGNPHPRSYYRCTYAGCNVRKHVERASADPKAVITTYEGKHNHETPAGRYSSSHGGTANSREKMQKVVSEKHSLNKEIDYGNKDQIPTTLQLKEEEIVA